jgi:HEAT repeat protein
VGDAQWEERRRQEALTLYQSAFQQATRDAERLAALAGLGRVGDEAAVPVLTAAIEKGSEPVKAAALQAYLAVAAAGLERRDTRRALALYQDALKLATRDAERIAALTGLGRAGSAEAIPAIRPFITQGTPRVQVTAALALHQIPGPEATRALADALPDAPPPARVALLRALGERRDPETVPALLAVARDADEEVRVAALQALGGVPTVEAVPTLLEALEKGSERVKVAAVDAYLRVGDAQLGQGQKQEALAIYHRAFDMAVNDAQRVAALAGIGRAGSAESLPRLEPLLDQAAGPVREAAINATIAIADQLFAANQREEATRAYQRIFAVVPGDQRALHVGGRLRALGVKMELVSQGGVVSYWWLIGPFPSPNEAAWGREFFPEKEVDLAKEYDFEGRKLLWQPYHTADGDGIVNLDSLFKPNDYVLCYAYAEVTVEQEQDVFLKMGSDDGIVCWVNGEKVHEKLVPRGLRVDEDNVPAHLKVGSNALLLKIIEIGGGWNVCLRITDANDQPLGFKMR